MFDRPAMLSRASLVGAVLCSVWMATAVLSASAEEGDASLRLEYQYIRTGVFDSSIGDIDIGNTDAHVYMLSASYSLTDRWRVVASLPWIRKRHTGALPHNPLIDFEDYEPPDLRVIDDGRYHGGWQDIYIGAQYSVERGPVTVSPFVSYGTPVDDYPFYGHSAIGRNLWHVPVGVAVDYSPYFENWSLSGDLAYVFTEKSLGVDVSHWLLNLRASYFLRPNFAPNVFASIKRGSKGLSFPDDFDLNNLDSADWYYHDRTIKHNWTNAGVGFDWILNERYLLSASWFTMVDPDQVNVVDRAWTVGLTRFFSGGRN